MPLAGVVAVVLGGSATAQASYTLGETFATDQCATGQALIQKATAGGAGYRATSSGVIVSWSYRAAASPPPSC